MKDVLEAVENLRIDRNDYVPTKNIAEETGLTVDQVNWAADELKDMKPSLVEGNAKQGYKITPHGTNQNRRWALLARQAQQREENTYTMPFVAKDMELLRLLLRACNHDSKLVERVILACKGLDKFDDEIIASLEQTKTLVELMEGRETTKEELVTRISDAKPENTLNS